MVNESRRKVFFKDHLWNIALSNMDKRTKEKTEKELELVDCSTCYDAECVYRKKGERFPPDAGGKGQCFRWAQDQYPFCWRNVSGDIIIIPQEIIDALADYLATIGGESND